MVTESVCDARLELPFILMVSSYVATVHAFVSLRKAIAHVEGCGRRRGEVYFVLPGSSLHRPISVSQSRYQMMHLFMPAYILSPLATVQKSQSRPGKHTDYSRQNVGKYKNTRSLPRLRLGAA